MVDKLSQEIKIAFEVERLSPLFESRTEYELFTTRHNSHKVHTAPLSSYQGNCYLGIDAGSTTTKVALIGEDGSLFIFFSTALTTVTRCRQRSPRSRIFMPSFRKGL